MYFADMRESIARRIRSILSDRNWKLLAFHTRQSLLENQKSFAILKLGSRRNKELCS